MRKDMSSETESAEEPSEGEFQSSNEDDSENDEFDFPLHGDYDTEDTESSSSKNKKKVTFQADDLLVHIREIPPRGFFSSASETSDSEEEQHGDDFNQTSDSEQDELGKTKDSSTIKSTCKKKVMKITNTSLLTELKDIRIQQCNKKKAPRRRIKSANAVLEPSRSDSTSERAKGQRLRSRGANISRPCDVEKYSQKRKKDKRDRDIKKSGKGVKKKTSISRESAKTDTGTVVCNSLELLSSDCAMTSTDQLWKLFDSEGTNCINTTKLSSKDASSSSCGEKDLKKKHEGRISSANSHRRQDIRSMTAQDRRLYSWLMANGDVPNPKDEAPSISLMWDRSSPTSV